MSQRDAMINRRYTYYFVNFHLGKNVGLSGLPYEMRFIYDGEWKKVSDITDAEALAATPLPDDFYEPRLFFVLNRYHGKVLII
jgi:hypothetical protein